MNHKKRKLAVLSGRIAMLEGRLKSDSYKLCFGSSRLMRQHPKHTSNQYRTMKNQKSYASLEEWQKDWKLARESMWYSVGHADKPCGNSEIQYDEQTQTLRLRLLENASQKRLMLLAEARGVSYEVAENSKDAAYGTLRKKADFLTIDGVEFTHREAHKLSSAYQNKQPISAILIKKKTKSGHIGYYLQLSFDEVVVQKMPTQGRILGLDLNQKGVAFCIVKADGNKLTESFTEVGPNKPKPFGFIEWDLETKSSTQREDIMSRALNHILKIASIHDVDKVAIS